MKRNKIRWSSDLAYSIGLIATDGNLSKDGRHITLVSKDINQLENFSKCLNLTAKISPHSSNFNPNGKYYHVQFSNVEFYRFLTEIGLTPNKTLSLGKLMIDKPYFGDFLRGVIDGDGCISTWINRRNKNTQWSLRIVSASKEFIVWLNNCIYEYYSIQGKIYQALRKDRVNHTFILKYGKKAAINITKIIGYETKISLKRKSALAIKLSLLTP